MASDHVIVAVGRDYAEIAPVDGVVLGSGAQRMEVSVDVAVLVLAKTESFPVTSQVVVAETVIVGAVPQTFLQTGGNYGFQREN